jgi:hypothetical protein
MDRAGDVAVARTQLSVARVDERRPLMHRGRGLDRGQSTQSPLRFRQDLIDSAALDPAIVPRFERRIVQRSEDAR